MRKHVTLGMLACVLLSIAGLLIFAPENVTGAAKQTLTAVY
jgi:hypothetical protein